jgi:nitrogenase molybdenum-iron protein alpha chain
MPKRRDFSNGLPDPIILREEILKKYPPKLAKKRAKAIVINDPQLEQEIMANVRTAPGIITQRGCTWCMAQSVVVSMPGSPAVTRHAPRKVKKTT